jgi:glycerol-3-phosphate dehydrogenase (NAD(P)+)
MTISKIAVYGAGSWGITLSRLLHEKGFQVHLWEFFPQVVEEVRATRENSKVLPGVTLDHEIAVTNDISEATKDVDMVVVVVPSHAVRATLEEAKAFIPEDRIVTIASKGLEVSTLKRMSEVALEVLGNSERICNLYGPSHAEEVSKRIPTVIVASSTNPETAKTVQKTFMVPYMRVYTNPDVIGVELGGSLKNIIAIAAGGIDGLGFGDNTKGALLARGLMEMMRLGIKMGAEQATFMGISGLGDLVTTCMSKHSRNRYVGECLGRGMKLKEILANMIMVAEGVNTTKAGYILSQKYDVDMPITSEVYKALYEGKDACQVIKDLMLREAKPEFDKHKG